MLNKELCTCKQSAALVNHRNRLANHSLNSALVRPGGWHASIMWCIHFNFSTGLSVVSIHYALNPIYSARFKRLLCRGSVRRRNARLFRSCIENRRSLMLQSEVNRFDCKLLFPAECSRCFRVHSCGVLLCNEASWGSWLSENTRGSAA